MYKPVGCVLYTFFFKVYTHYTSKISLREPLSLFVEGALCEALELATQAGGLHPLAPCGFKKNIKRAKLI